MARMRTRLFLGGVLIMAVAMNGAAGADDGARDDAGAANPLETALERPVASGLMVLSLVDGGQGMMLGLHPGEIIVTYDGLAVATVEALTLAKAAVESRTEIPVLVASHDGTERTITMAPGSLGLQLAPVVEGQAPAPLPADTGALLDPSVVGDRDEWMAFSIAGKEIGIEHVQLRVEEGVLHLTHEVAFDGGDDWGFHHALVTASVRLGVTADPFEMSYTNPLNGWSSTSEVVRDARGRPVWRTASGPKDAPRDIKEVPVQRDVSALSSYLVTQVARLMPQEKGACFRFRPVSDWDGTPSLQAAIVCTGPETLTVDGEEVATWHYVQRTLAGAESGQYWFDADRRLVQADYAGPITRRTDKARALALVTAPELKLRTAE